MFERNRIVVHKLYSHTDEKIMSWKPRDNRTFTLESPAKTGQSEYFNVLVK